MDGSVSGFYFGGINHDGRERALFLLIHLLKSKNTKGELQEHLIDWYKYSGGYKLTNEDIKHKIEYQWNRNYNFGTPYIKELLEDLGKVEIMEGCELHGSKNSINRST